MASLTSGGVESVFGPDPLPELVNAERALKELARVVRQRHVITAAFRRATARANADSAQAVSPEAVFARHHRLTNDLESLAKRAGDLTPAFAAAIADLETALHAVAARAAVGGLTQKDQAQIDELYAATTWAAAEVRRMPAHSRSGIPRALRGIFWRRARRAYGTLVAALDEQGRHWQTIGHGDRNP
jgi:hypothetical protein